MKSKATLEAKIKFAYYAYLRRIRIYLKEHNQQPNGTPTIEYYTKHYHSKCFNCNRTTVSLARIDRNGAFTNDNLRPSCGPCDGLCLPKVGNYKKDKSIVSFTDWLDQWKDDEHAKRIIGHLNKTK